MNTSDFKELKVWQKAIDVTLDVYKIVRILPSEEKFCLGDQIRRCAISIPSNIAEGHSRNSIKDYIRFLSISRGSLAELQTQLILCMRLMYFSEKEFSDINTRLVEIDKMLSSLMKTLHKSVEY